MPRGKGIAHGVQGPGRPGARRNGGERYPSEASRPIEKETLTNPRGKREAPRRRDA